MKLDSFVSDKFYEKIINKLGLFTADCSIASSLLPIY
jgi:hypothetical protein